MKSACGPARRRSDILRAARRRTCESARTGAPPRIHIRTEAFRRPSFQQIAGVRAVRTAEHQLTMKPEGIRALAEQRVVEGAEREGLSLLLFVILPQLHQHQLAD